MTTKSSEQLVSVGTFRSIADAQIAKGILDEAGVESMIRSDNAGGMFAAIDAAYLLVRTEDVDRASEALAEMEGPEETGEPEE
jgi:putative signal transducing protein